MKTLIQLMVVAIIFGGVSATATIFMQPKATSPTVAAADDPAPSGEGTADSAVETTPTDGSDADSSHDHGPATGSPTAPPSYDENALAAAEPPKHATQPPPKAPPVDSGHDSSPTATSPKDSEEVQPEARVAVRPPYTPEGDEAGGLINLLRERSRTALETERRLAERQEAMQLIFEDLRGEQARTMKIRERLSNELKESRQAVDAALLALDAERVALQKEQADAKKTAEESLREKPPATANDSTNTGGSPEDNVNLKKMAAVFDGMPAENVSSVFEQLVKNKRIDAVVSLMNAMKERQVSKVLANISTTNAELAADLTDRLKRLKTSQPAAK
ncbi:MAG: hypothetical protein JSS49_05770 [Planctomycetes bacterium]|nr:hypothetical protein [Planctomycetota bacterium]